jgi:hypothetical protein
MRKERKPRKSRAKSSSMSKAGRKPVSDPRRTSHLMLFRSEREACDAFASKLGLGFSTWARAVLLAAVATGLGDGKLAPGSVGHAFAVMTKAILLELRDLAEPKRKDVLATLMLAFAGDSEEALKEISLGFQ